MGDSYIQWEELKKFLFCKKDIEFMPLPKNDKTCILLEGLKKYGFVSQDTKLSHFRVIWGIPIQSNDYPFEPIKWRKNKQLLKYFVGKTICKSFIDFYGSRDCFVYYIFGDKHGERCSLPNTDKKRLEQSADYEILKKLLEEFRDEEEI